jgi:hypothetical protein
MSTESFQSSREAYQHCLATGLISRRVAEVLETLVDAGPMNQTMVHQAIIKRTGIVGLEKYSVSPRFAVLERMGLIREIGRQPCPVSRRSTVFYEATNLRPLCTEAEAMDVAPRKNSMAQLKAENAELRTENEKLRELLNVRTAAVNHREDCIRKNPTPVQTTLFSHLAA